MSRAISIGIERFKIPVVIEVLLNLVAVFDALYASLVLTETLLLLVVLVMQDLMIVDKLLDGSVTKSGELGVRYVPLI